MEVFNTHMWQIFNISSIGSLMMMNNINSIIYMGSFIYLLSKSHNKFIQILQETVDINYNTSNI